MQRFTLACSTWRCCSLCSPAAPLIIAPLQKFVNQPGIPVETAVRVYRRYLKLEPTHVEEFIAYLKAQVRTGAT